MFKKPSQKHSSDIRKPGGIGLGVSISNTIVEHFGGEINYERTLGVGIRFYFSIPALKN